MYGQRLSFERKYHLIAAFKYFPCGTRYLDKNLGKQMILLPQARAEQNTIKPSHTQLLDSNVLIQQRNITHHTAGGRLFFHV